VFRANNTTMELRVCPGTNPAKREALLQKWYRGRLRELIPQLLAKWERKVGVKVVEVRIRRMKTRWGSCNTAAGRVWLNLELAKKSPACLEYVLVHEMVHLIERHHTDRFKQCMDRVMPQWRARREE